MISRRVEKTFDKLNEGGIYNYNLEQALAKVVEAAEHAHFATDNRQEIVARIMLAESLTELELALKGCGA